MTRKTMPLWRRERLGLSMIAASLVAIVLTGGLIFDNLRDARETRVRAQGISLIRVLSGMPFEELVPSSNPAALLRALEVSENKDDFAYATVLDRAGRTLAEVAAPGILVPPVAPPAHPSEWLGERLLPGPDARQGLLEFHAPLLQNGEFAGLLRLGYFQPGYGLPPEQVPFFATLALIIFLLTPVFYFLVRREIKPLQAASADLQSAVENGRMQPVAITATGELGQFMGRFNEFVDFASRRIAELDSERERVVTSTRLLSYRKQRMLRVLESLPDAILVLDETGKIGFANRHFQDMFGVSGDDIAGSASLEWCVHDDVRSFLERCSGQGQYLVEPLEFVPESASNRTYVVTAYPLFAPDDAKSIGCLVAVRDITVEVLARNSRAEFVAHVAHELKTPLTVLSLYSESLLNEGGDEEARVEAANVIHDEVERLSLLINNLLSITKIEMGSLDLQHQRVRLQDLLKDVFDVAAHAGADRGLDFALEIPSEITPLNLDKELIRIALNNLLTNAVKYNRDGGTVTLRASELDDVVRIEVTDTGIGIAPEDQALVFDKFYRSDDDEVRERSGHGLGLALVRDIVELHNGSVSVSSVVGEGTTFAVELWKYSHSMRQVS